LDIRSFCNRIAYITRRRFPSVPHLSFAAATVLNTIASEIAGIQRTLCD
jgi:hypothetical protein